MTAGVPEVLDARSADFRMFKRKRIGYKFRNFRQAETENGPAKCPTPPAFFIVSEDCRARGAGVGDMCGRVVVCHPAGSRSIHAVEDFFSRYTVAESSARAYPKAENVYALVPDRRLIADLGGRDTFVNFWGREDTIDDTTVVIRHAPGMYYSKGREAFRALFTDDVRSRSGTPASSKTSKPASSSGR